MPNTQNVKTMLEILQGRDYKDIDALVKLTNLKNDSDKSLSDRSMREKWAVYMIWFLLYWSTIVFVILLLHGFGNSYGYFNISQDLVMWILGYGVINFFVFPLIVSKYLFSQGKSSNILSEIWAKITGLNKVGKTSDI